jgi:DNA-binding NarL/FixJ family response regulator
MTGPHAFGRTDGARKLSVLVADDNPLILEQASALLARDFNVVAAVADGRQALDASLRLDPDVAVLDITMPELDGFQTARELRRAGSRAKIVIMTMHNSDGHVAAAIESGAQGYVVKTQLDSDLASAIHHAIAGRLFVPTLTSLLAVTRPGTGAHTLQIRLDDRDCLDGVSRLLSAALQRGDVAAIVATDATRAGIAQQLSARGWDIPRETDRGKYLSLDVTAAMSQVMVGRRLDIDRLAAAIDDLERSRLAVSAPRLTIVGEMTVVLCRDANTRAAIQLEQAWDNLTRDLPFLTVCNYPATCFSEAVDPELFPAVCAVHSFVCHADGP